MAQLAMPMILIFLLLVVSEDAADLTLPGSSVRQHSECHQLVCYVAVPRDQQQQQQQQHYGAGPGSHLNCSETMPGEEVTSRFRVHPLQCLLVRGERPGDGDKLFLSWSGRLPASQPSGRRQSLLVERVADRAFQRMATLLDLGYERAWKHFSLTFVMFQRLSAADFLALPRLQSLTMWAPQRLDADTFLPLQAADDDFILKLICEPSSSSVRETDSPSSMMHSLWWRSREWSLSLSQCAWQARCELFQAPRDSLALKLAARLYRTSWEPESGPSGLSVAASKPVYSSTCPLVNDLDGDLWKVAYQEAFAQLETDLEYDVETDVRLAPNASVPPSGDSVQDLLVRDPPVRDPLMRDPLGSVDGLISENESMGESEEESVEVEEADFPASKRPSSELDRRNQPAKVDSERIPIVPPPPSTLTSTQSHYNNSSPRLSQSSNCGSTWNFSSLQFTEVDLIRIWVFLVLAVSLLNLLLTSVLICLVAKYCRLARCSIRNPAYQKTQIFSAANSREPHTFLYHSVDR